MLLHFDADDRALRPALGEAATQPPGGGLPIFGGGAVDAAHVADLGFGERHIDAVRKIPVGAARFGLAPRAPRVEGFAGDPAHRRRRLDVAAAEDQAAHLAGELGGDLRGAPALRLPRRRLLRYPSLPHSPTVPDWWVGGKLSARSWGGFRSASNEVEKSAVVVSGFARPDRLHQHGDHRSQRREPHRGVDAGAGGVAARAATAWDVGREVGPHGAARLGARLIGFGRVSETLILPGSPETLRLPIPACVAFRRERRGDPTGSAAASWRGARGRPAAE